MKCELFVWNGETLAHKKKENTMMVHFRGSEKMHSGERNFRIEVMLNEDNNEKQESAIKKGQIWFKEGDNEIGMMNSLERHSAGIGITVQSNCGKHTGRGVF